MRMFDVSFPKMAYLRAQLSGAQIELELCKAFAQLAEVDQGFLGCLGALVGEDVRFISLKVGFLVVEWRLEAI